VQLSSQTVALVCRGQPPGLFSELLKRLRIRLFTLIVAGIALSVNYLSLFYTQP